MKMKSVNQINAQAKIYEMWKSVNIVNYAIKTNFVSRTDDVVQTRAISNGLLKAELLTNISQQTFLHDAIHIWNKTPNAIQQCKTQSSAKLAI